MTDSAELRPRPRLTDEGLRFVADGHLATLSTVRADGTPHVVTVGFTWDVDDALVRVITMEGSQKVRNVERSGYGAVCQIVGPQWLTLEGPARVAREGDAVHDAEARYATRYRPPRPNPERVVIEIAVSRALGTPTLFEAGR